MTLSTSSGVETAAPILPDEWAGALREAPKQVDRATPGGVTATPITRISHLSRHHATIAFSHRATIEAPYRQLNPDSACRCASAFRITPHGS